MKNLSKKPQKLEEMIGDSKTLGMGIYTIPDIHLILGYPLYKIRRYIRKYWDNVGQKLFNDTYSWEDTKSRKVVPFLVLIELYTFFELLEKGADTLTVATARATMAKELETPFPFASENFLTDGKKIWYYTREGLLVNADKTQQTNFVKIIESFAKKIEFSENLLAQRFYPLENNKNIVVDPHHQFGQPIIKGSNIVTETIYSMVKSGEKKQSIQTLYKLTNKQVDDVMYFHKQAA